MDAAYRSLSIHFYLLFFFELMPEANILVSVVAVVAVAVANDSVESAVDFPILDRYLMPKR